MTNPSISPKSRYPAANRSKDTRVRDSGGAGAGDLPCLADLYWDDPVGRIGVVRAGLPASAVRPLSEQLGVSNESLYELLGLNRASVLRQARHGQHISPEATERAVFIAGLVRMVAGMLPDGRAHAGFDAAKWVARWLETPQPALGGEPAAAYLDTDDGRAMVRSILGQIESGTYA